MIERALRHLQVERVVTLRGYVSVQRFYLYAERGLSRNRVSIWLHEGRLHIAYRDNSACALLLPLRSHGTAGA